MKQLLERKHGTRTIVFALLLTILAWLTPVNAGVVKAALGDATISVDEEGYLFFDEATGTITGYEGEITEVDLSKISDENGITITSIGDEAFSECGGLTSVNIPNSVTTIGDNAFSYCSGLINVNIPDSVITIGSSAFLCCSELTSVNIPNGVTTIRDEAFSECRGLTSVNIPNSVTTIGGNAFSHCSGLTSVNIPNSVITIGEWAFSRCSELTSVNIPNSVTTIGDNAFEDCDSLRSITVGVGNQNYSSQEGVLFDKAKKWLLQYPSGNKRTFYEVPNSVTAIGDNAFEGCWNLTSVNISNSVITIGDNAFSHCGGLTSVSIPNSVTTIGDDAFYNCYELTSVVIPNSVTTIGYKAFGYQRDDYYLIKVSDFKIYGYSNNSAAAEYAREEGFDYVIVRNEDTKPDDSNQGANNNQGENSNNQIDKNVEDKPATVTTKTKTGTTVNDKKSNGSYVVTQTKNGGGTVAYKKPVNKKKSSVTIPATVKIEGKTYKVTAVEKNAFKGNKNLKSVKIGSNIEKIGANAFNKCTKLKTVKLPSKVKTIQKGAFAGCKNLKNITIQTKKLTKKTVGAGAFKGVNGKATVKVPKGKAKAYQRLLRSKGLSKKAKVK